MIFNEAQRRFCRTACPKMDVHPECRVCELENPHIVREDVRAGHPRRLELHVHPGRTWEGEEVHLLDAADVLGLVRDGFLIHLYQEGEEFLEPGELTPTRPVVKTGTAHLDREAEMVRISLFKHRDRVWVTVPDWLAGLYLGTTAIAPVRELLPVEG
ncbi:MAG: hypothetical protein QMC96_12150 [Methanomicrobiales archaeon]|nr:hypothetical protein [Methanomicrobiales archaeon]